MISRQYTSEGIILGRRNFGEADRIISVYSREKGRVSLIAKGVRRPKSKKRGSLEIFSLIKYQASDSRGLDIITEAEIINDYKKIRSSLHKVSLAYYFMEVIGKITHEGERNTQLFEHLIDSLSDLESQTKLKKLRLGFIENILVMLGYWPEGKVLTNPDEVLEDVIERQISSVRVGKRMLE